MKWLLQFTVREDEVKQNRRLPEIALFDTDGNPISLGAGSSGAPIATWAPDTDYSLGQVVINSGSLYQAVDDHTSGAVFGGDSAHWTTLDAETDALALAQLATHAGLTTTAHGGIVASSDSRLTDARTPTAHKTSHAVGGSDVLSPADIGAIASSDSRLTDARTPTAHKASHAVGGSDALSPADIAAVPQSLVDAKGDLIVGTADNTVARKAVGTNGQILTSDTASAGGVKWADTAAPTAHKTSHGSGGSDPVTPSDIGAVALSLVDARGDLIVATADNVVARLGVGADGTVLAADSAQSGGLAWAAAPVPKSLVDAKGDLLVGTADNTVARKAAGSNGKFLSAQSGQSDGLLWDDPVTARTTVQWTTGSLANNASENDDQAVFKASQCYSITTDRAARVRAYSTSAHRTADAARAAGTDPTGNHGCLLDVVLIAGTLTIDLSPVVDLVNLDGTPATTIYFAVTNTSGSTGTVQVTITVRKSE